MLRLQVEYGAAYGESSGIRPVVSGQDLRQRRLSGSVVPDEAVHLTRPDGHADLVQGNGGTEGHRQVAQSEVPGALIRRRRSRPGFLAGRAIITVTHLLSFTPGVHRIGFGQ